MNEINLKYAEIHELRLYLNSTDYKEHRNDENGIIDKELNEQRQQARDRINELEIEIKELEEDINSLTEVTEIKQIL
jgi:HAMP domain-containing protein